jgi:hypothetical protein
VVCVTAACHNPYSAQHGKVGQCWVTIRNAVAEDCCVRVPSEQTLRTLIQEVVDDWLKTHNPLDPQPVISTGGGAGPAEMPTELDTAINLLAYAFVKQQTVKEEYVIRFICDAWSHFVMVL